MTGGMVPDGNPGERPVPIAQPRGPRRLRRLAGQAGLLLVLAAVAIPMVRTIYLVKARRSTAALLVRLDRDDPGWRFAQIEAARKVIPDDQNPAMGVKAAFAAIPPGKRQPPRPVGAAAGTGGPQGWEQATMEVAALDPPEQIPARRFAVLRAERDALAPAVALARRLADASEGRYPVKWALNPLETPLPDAQNSRTVARLLALDAAVRGQEGDIDGAIVSCRAALNVGRAIGDEPVAISQLVRIAEVGTALNCLGRSLAQGEASDETLAAVQALLEEESARDLFRIVARGERASLDDLFGRLATGEVKLGRKGERGDPIRHWLYEETIFTYDRKLALAVMTNAVEVAGLPTRQHRLGMARWSQEIDRANGAASPYEKVAYMLVPALDTCAAGHARSQAVLASAVVAVAAERYRLKHGRWPDSPDRLAPWPLRTVPDDPLAEGPLRFVRSGLGLTVYSVGYDGEDDGDFLPEDQRTARSPSRPRRRPHSWEGLDAGFRLWNVSRRRSPPATRSGGPDDGFVGE